MKLTKFSKRVENTVGKGRNCSWWAITPFFTVFSKDMHCRHVKTIINASRVSWHFGHWEHVINPFPNKPWFLHVWSTSLLKTLWEKEKLLGSNLSFSRAICPLRKVFSSNSENFLPFSSNLKLSSAKSFSLEESKFIDWERNKFMPISIYLYQTT